ncbi:MAG: DUF2153 family protein [Candidatus Bathyarchaeota archaeon]|nr:MAG: DUF2153 family protein [Candidatus Bathyarchaeota archaeon]
MSERWTDVSEKILEQLKQLEEAKNKDRLELVRSMRFVLRALEMSLVGWKQWVNNPDIMTKFSQEDLVTMNKKLSEFTRSFIQYDIEATKLGAQKGLKAVEKAKRKKRLKPKTSYVA